MNCEGAVYYKIKFKNNPATIEGVTPYTTPERIREREKSYEDVRTVVEARPAKPTDKAVCEYCGERVAVRKALLKRLADNIHISGDAGKHLTVCDMVEIAQG